MRVREETLWKALQTTPCRPAGVPLHKHDWCTGKRKSRRVRKSLIRTDGVRFQAPSKETLGRLKTVPKKAEKHIAVVRITGSTQRFFCGNIFRL